VVPHSQCSLRENPKFLQNFRSKNNSLKEILWLLFLFNICHSNSGLAFKSINYCIAAQNCCYLIGENSPKLCQKRIWALWMRHMIICLNFYNFLTKYVAYLYGFILKIKSHSCEFQIAWYFLSSSNINKVMGT
jgi:hypothetical protein